MTKDLTTFKLSKSLKQHIREVAKEQKTKMSELLAQQLLNLFTSKTEIEIPKMQKGSVSDLTPTSVLLPKNILQEVGKFAANHNVTNSDVYRYCLANL